MPPLVIDTPWTRMVVFGLMYVIEGIPIGFTEKFVPFYLEKAGLSSSEVGEFGYWDSWPWTIKWFFAPFVDTFLSPRQWLLFAQAAMTITLLPVAFMGGSFRSTFSMLKVLVVSHNICSATNDIAVDTLAIGSLPVQEEAAVNGVMFGAQELGAILGGSLALRMASLMGYTSGVLFILALLVVIFFSVSLRMPAPPTDGEARKPAPARLRSYVFNLWTAFFGGWQIWAALTFAFFPSGARLLSGLHATTWMSSHGLGEEDVARVELLSKAAGVATTVLGGIVSTRVGPRRMIACSYLATCGLSFWISTWTLQTWSTTRWMLVKLLYQAFSGLHAGPQMGLFMRSCSDGVGATQFTLFCCLCNWADARSKYYHGQLIDAEGYYSALWWDALYGVIPLIFLPLVGRDARAHKD